MASFAINNPISMMRSSLAMSNTYTNLGDSIAKLASGLKIQSAADAPVEFVHAEFMRAEIATINQGMRNANDAISLVQTAEGSMQVIDEKLIRMKELAEQAATGTYDAVQRSIIDSEYQQMASEITRIANMTEFNNIKLLNGNISSDEYYGGFYNDFPGKLKLHFGDTNNRNMDFTYLQVDSVTASALGVGNNANSDSLGYSISTQEGAQHALVAIEMAIESKNLIRADLGAMETRLEAVVDKLAFEAENTAAARSGLIDVDVAEEMTNFTRQQIVLQSAGAMFSQASITAQMALDVLK